MATITLTGVNRSFGSVRAVHDISLTIADGEFFTLLGPSGCGKTTLLRMVAGFAELETGEIRFGERRIDTLPAHRRNTGMVFQNYAIFPNLKVADNVAYGLRARKVASLEDRRARGAARFALVKLAELWRSLAASALGRPVAARRHRPRPRHRARGAACSTSRSPTSMRNCGSRCAARSASFSNRSASPRSMSRMIRKRRSPISDRIAVMRQGRFEQIGAPDEIYRRPASPFVAEFMGTTNLLSGASRRKAASIKVGETEFAVPRLDAPDGTTLSFSLRPEALRPLIDGEAAPQGWAVVPAQLTRLEFLGALTRIEATPEPWRSFARRLARPSARIA